MRMSPCHEQAMRDADADDASDTEDAADDRVPQVASPLDSGDETTPPTGGATPPITLRPSPWAVFTTVTLVIFSVTRITIKLKLTH